MGVPHHPVLARSCWTAWTSSPSGPSASPPCSGTGSARARGRRGGLRRSAADGDPGLHHPHRHHLRLHLRRARAGSPAGGERSPRRPARPRWRPSPRGWRRSGKIERTAEGAPKEGVFTGAPRHQPVHRPAGPGLGRQLRPRRLRHRRGDERAGARRARLRVRPEVRAAHQAGDPAGRRARPRRPVDELDERLHRGRRAASTRASSPGCHSAEARERMAPGARAATGCGKPTVTYRQQDWGFSPPALLGHAHPHRLLREVRPGARRASRSRTTSSRCGCRTSTRRRCSPGKGEPPLAKVPSFVEHHLPEAAAVPPGARWRRWTPSSTPPGTTRATSRRTTTSAPFDPAARAALAAGGHLRRRPRARRDAPALLPLLEPGDEGARAGRRSTSR